MNYYYILSSVISFLMVIIIVPPIRGFTLRLGFVDDQSLSSLRSSPVPLGGGVAIFSGLILAAFLLFALGKVEVAEPIIGMIFGSIFIFLIGLCDDYFELSPLTKLVGQIISAFLFLSFIDKPPAIMSEASYFFFATIWIAAFQNALNFLDNMDGLCSGISLIIAGGFGVLFIVKEMPQFAIISFALAGSALGFLRYNSAPASIFLGNAGSLLFGYILSCLSLLHLNSSASLSSALGPLMMMAYPAFDLIFVTFTRLNEDRKVYLGSNDHSSNRLNLLGYTKKWTVYIIYFINAALVVLGLLIYYLEESRFQTIVVFSLAFILALIGSHLYKNFHSIWRRIFHVFRDIVAINLAFIVYHILKQGPPYYFHEIVIRLWQISIPIVWINYFWIFVFTVMGVYEIPGEAKLKYHFRAYLKAILVGAGLFILINYRLSEGLQVSFLWVTHYAIIFLATIGLVLVINEAIGKRLRIGRQGKRKCVVVSLYPGEIPRNILNLFSDYYDIQGYIGNDVKNEVKWLGSIRELHMLLNQYHVAHIGVAMPQNCQMDLRPIFRSAYYLETIFLFPNMNLDNLNGFTVRETKFKKIIMVLSAPRLIIIKIIIRLRDFAIAFCLLLLSLPYDLLGGLGQGKWQTKKI